MQSQISVGKKLFASFGAALALTLGVSFTSLEAIGSLGASIDKLIKVNARKLYLAGEINTVTSDIVAEERGILLRAQMKDPATMEKYNQAFRASTTRLKQRLDEFVPLVETAEARRMIEDIQAACPRIVQEHEEMYRLAVDGKLAAATKIEAETVMPLVMRISDEGDALAQQQNALMTSVASRAVDKVSYSR